VFTDGGERASSVFGLLAFDANDRSHDECRNNVCTQEGVELNEDARRNALVSNVGFVVGGVALAGSLYFFLGPPGKAMQATRPATAQRRLPWSIAAGARNSQASAHEYGPILWGG
jgi:hypothetical protein